MKAGCESKEVKLARSIELPVIQSSAAKAPIAHSRTSRWRAAVLTLLTLLMAAHIVQWWLMGSTVSPIEPSETMYTLQQGAVNAGLIFFSLAILSTLIFGRFVCGWGCHIVALQDFCTWMMLKVGIKPKQFRSRLLVFVPLIVALYMFVWPTLYRFIAAPPNEPVIPQFTNHLVTTGFWDTFPPVAVAIPFLFICGFMTVYFMGSKGFCTYACPYGGFFGIADRFAPGKIRVTDACNQCGHCTAVCTSNVLVHAEVKQFGMVVDAGCMKCMDCVSVCPNDALYFGFGKPSLGTSGHIAKSPSLSWPEELLGAFVFFGSFVAVWDVYQLVPMFMALGIAIVTTYLALMLVKLFRMSDLSFYGYVLRSSGTLQRAGWVFVLFSALWIVLNVHSGVVRYHERAGAMAFQNLQIPDELALSGPNPGSWLSPADKSNVAKGQAHFYTAMKIGLFTNKEALSKLAWFDYLAGDSEAALNLLASAAAHQSGEGKALSLYYRGAILNRLGRYQEAKTELQKALKERPDLRVAHEELGESLWQMGEKQAAVDLWTKAVEENPDLALANYQLAGAAALVGNTEAAAEYESQGRQHTPDDPYFHWMIGLRLQNIGMNSLAEKHFQRAIELDQSFIMRRERRPRP
jgi:tetratricopeptide (TPR) repeat protein/NAD-dependent dihydropyrimidine dehydrogenase PreA subunit